MKKTLLILIFFTAVFANAQKSLKDYTEITNLMLSETQYTFDKPNGGIILIWYIPTVYWEYSFKAGNDLNDKQIEEYVEILNRHTVYIVVDADITAMGNAVVKPEKEIFDNSMIVNEKGHKFHPLIEDELDPDFKMFKTIIQPMLSNMLGQLGEGMVILAFEAENNDKKPLIDPLRTEKISLKYKEYDYTIDMPLASLLEKKVCPFDKEKLNGKWNFCQIHGEKLK